MRMLAIYRVLSELSRSPPEARGWIPSLMLGASCIYMFNALIYRASDDRPEQALAEAAALWVYPTVDPADPANVGADLIEDPALVPCTTARGLYFVSALLRDEGNLRLPRARLLDRGLLARLYGLPNLTDVAKALGGGSLGLSARSTANKARTANRKITIPITAFLSQPTVHDFNLAARGIVTRPPMAMTGEDGPMNRFHADDDSEESLDTAFSKLWAQFPSDLVQCSPNHRYRNQPAYIHLSHEERHTITIDFFKSFSLPFDAVYIRTCQDPAQWRTLFFEKFFPPPGVDLSSKLQNFRNCTYLNAYSQELKRLRPRDIQRIRATLWEQFDQLRWLPHAESDRMWPTRPRQLSRIWTPLPAEHKTPAANIVVNPRFYSGPQCIHLVNTVPQPNPSLVEEDQAFEDMYDRVLVRQSNTVGDRTSLEEELDSIRREQAFQADQSNALRREEEESSPALPAAIPAPRRIRPLYAEEEEESSPAPSFLETARGRVSNASSFSHFARGLKRSHSDDLPDLSDLLTRCVRPRTSRSSFTPVPLTEQPLWGRVDTPRSITPVEEQHTGEFKPYLEDDDKDDDTGEFKPSLDYGDEDDDTGEFKPSPDYDDDEDDTGEFKSSLDFDDDEDDDTGEFKFVKGK